MPTAASPSNTNSSSSSNTGSQSGTLSTSLSNTTNTNTNMGPNGTVQNQNQQGGEQLSKTNLYIRGLQQGTTDKDLVNMCAQWVQPGHQHNISEWASKKKKKNKTRRKLQPIQPLWLPFKSDSGYDMDAIKPLSDLCLCLCLPCGFVSCLSGPHITLNCIISRHTAPCVRPLCKFILIVFAARGFYWPAIDLLNKFAFEQTMQKWCCLWARSIYILF